MTSAWLEAFDGCANQIARALEALAEQWAV